MRSTGAAKMLMAAGWMVGTLAIMAQVPPPPPDRPRVSPPAIAGGLLEGTPQQGKRLTIYYSRPNIKPPGGGEARKVWGTLVPWGKVWRLGANEATLMTTELPLQFGNVTVPAGAYSLFMLPEENGASKLIINKHVGQSGTAYDEKQDLARVDLKKDDISGQVESLTFVIDSPQTGGTGALRIAWDRTQYSVPFTVKK